MVAWYRFVYALAKLVGAVAYGIFHRSQSVAHTAYLAGGRWGRRERKPLTAIWRWVGLLKK
jgi:hypothetical protein